MASHSTANRHLQAGDELHRSLEGLAPCLRPPRLQAVRASYVKARDASRDGGERASALERIANVDYDLAALAHSPELQLLGLVSCIDNYCEAVSVAQAHLRKTDAWLQGCCSRVQAVLQDMTDIAGVSIDLMLSVRDKIEAGMAAASRLYPPLVEQRVWWHQQICSVVIAAALELLHGHCVKRAYSAIMDGERSARILEDQLGKVSRWTPAAGLMGRWACGEACLGVDAC
jgi:hypothetical protein